MAVYRVHWSFLVEAAGPYQAARRAWTKIFGRTDKPGPDDFCVFRVIPARSAPRGDKPVWVDLETDPEAEIIDLAEKTRRVYSDDTDRAFVSSSVRAAATAAAELKIDPQQLSDFLVFATEELAASPTTSPAELAEAARRQGVLR